MGYAKEWFGKDVCPVFLGFYLLDFYFTLLYLIAEVMPFKTDMFSSGFVALRLYKRHYLCILGRRVGKVSLGCYRRIW